VTESGVDPGGDVLAVKPAAAAIGVGYLRARGAEEAMEAAKAMLDQARARRSSTNLPLAPARVSSCDLGMATDCACKPDAVVVEV